MFVVLFTITFMPFHYVSRFLGTNSTQNICAQITAHEHNTVDHNTLPTT